MFHELSEYRELLVRMTRRDLLLRYKQTVMGFGWAVFMPLRQHGGLLGHLHARRADRHRRCRIRCSRTAGCSSWNFFASALRFAVNVAHRQHRTWSPRSISRGRSFRSPRSLVSLVDFAVASTVLVGADDLLPRRAGVGAAARCRSIVAVQCCSPPRIALLLAMGNLFYRDVKYLFEIVLTVWMFATSVVYPDRAGRRPARRAAAAQPDDADHRRLPLGRPPRRAAAIRSRSRGDRARLVRAVLGVGWLCFHRAEFQFAENI